jgi:hypothetical protein
MALGFIKLLRLTTHPTPTGSSTEFGGDGGSGWDFIFDKIPEGALPTINWGISLFMGRGSERVRCCGPARKQDGAGRAVIVRCTEREIRTRIIGILLSRGSRQNSMSRRSETTKSDLG